MTQASVTAQGTIPEPQPSPFVHRDWFMFFKLFSLSGAVFAGLSVVLSAALAHLPQFAAGVPAMVQTALVQQQFHALGLLVVALAMLQLGPNRWLVLAGGLMLTGMLLFSLNIYARQLLGWDAARALVPWGGGAWIAAWIALALGLMRKDPNDRD